LDEYCRLIWHVFEIGSCHVAIFGIIIFFIHANLWNVLWLSFGIQSVHKCQHFFTFWWVYYRPRTIKLLVKSLKSWCLSADAIPLLLEVLLVNIQTISTFMIFIGGVGLIKWEAMVRKLWHIVMVELEWMLHHWTLLFIQSILLKFGSVCESQKLLLRGVGPSFQILQWTSTWPFETSRRMFIGSLLRNGNLRELKDRGAFLLIGLLCDAFDQLVGVGSRRRHLRNVELHQAIEFS
jgi:hypothetical protein